MTEIQKYLGVAVGGVVIGLLATFLLGGASFGGVYNQVINEFRQGIKVGTTNQFIIDSVGALTTTGGLTIGATGTQADNFAFGTCNLDTEGAAIAAFQTVAYDCGSGTEGETALTGIVVGDNVNIAQPTTTPATMNSLRVTGVAASSTAGFIVVTLTNASSSAITPAGTATSTWQYQVWR